MVREQRHCHPHSSQDTNKLFQNKMTRSAINCELCDFTCRSKPSLQRHIALVHTSQYIPKEQITKKRKIPIITCTECHSTFSSKIKMKKHVDEEHRNEERNKEQKESPLRKEAKKEDLNVRITIDQEQVNNPMEETPEEEKETKEAQKEEEVLGMRKRIYDQNQRLYCLEQERDKLIEENKNIKDEANTKVRELEENIQQEAKAVKHKVKQFEKTLLEQIKMIELQNKEIAKLKVSKPTPDTAQAEITTKVTTDDRIEISIKCKECNFTGKTWN